MIYLDNAADTAVLQTVREAVSACMRSAGNPSSIHSAGQNNARLIETAREQVAKLIGADPDEVYFTSGGTESNNLMCRLAKSENILFSEMEHPSVIKALAWHDSADLRIESDGVIDLDTLRRDVEFVEWQESLRRQNGFGDDSASSNTLLFVQWMNNETGAVQPMEKIGHLAEKYNVMLLTDAVQAVGHTPIDVHQCNVDCLTLSGHKFGAPPGVGAIYIRRGIEVDPLIKGGGQERGLRSGTENVPGIVGLGIAADYAQKNLEHHRSVWKSLRKIFIDRLDLETPFWINGTNAYSPIISLTIPEIPAENLVTYLDAHGVCISAGAACHANGSAPSPTLTVMGLTPEHAMSTVRISMGYGTSEFDMETAANTIVDAVRFFKSFSNS